MRFCDFFISYKIGLKGIQSSIPFTKLPLYRKIAVITAFATGLLIIILGLINQKTPALMVLILGILLLILFLAIDSTKKSLDTMLQEHYLPYSQNRMDMVANLLRKYNVYNNNSIDLLIIEAQEAQLRCDYFAPLKKSLKALSAIIIPIVAYVAQKISDAATQSEMITMALYAIAIIILVFSFILSIAPLLKDLFYRDYNKYSELIYDLRQIKLFYLNCDSPTNQ